MAPDPLLPQFRAKIIAVAPIAAPDAGRTAQRPPKNKEAQVQQLKSLTLADLGNIQVTKVTKEPEDVRQTPAAIHVLTQNDIRLSAAIMLPDLLHAVSGVKVVESQSN